MILITLEHLIKLTLGSVSVYVNILDFSILRDGFYFEYDFVTMTASNLNVLDM